MKAADLSKSALRAFRYPHWREVVDGVSRGWYPAFITYPFEPAPRFGWGKPAHAELHRIIDRERHLYQARIRAILAEDRLAAIALDAPDDSREPSWGNRWFTGIDAAALYHFVATERPRRYVEIGSGNSTKFARRAMRDYGIESEITCIDPQPRAEIGQIADHVVAKPLEKLDLAIFDRVSQGDIVFLNSSHRCFTGSDVTVFFMEVLPKLPRDTLIQIHDIHLPYDYPHHRNRHYESEQYLLAAMLLAAPEKFRIEMANRFVVEDEELFRMLAPRWQFTDGRIVWSRDKFVRGSSFWFRKICSV